jgi:type III restriction enzyme
MSDAINTEALLPLFKPWEEPRQHREPPLQPGDSARTVPGRRSSRCHLVPRLRDQVEMWRHNGYFGASGTTRTLLKHWFESDHPGGFHYHYCQREAIETFIWLHEVAKYHSLSSLYSSLYGDDKTPIPVESFTEEDDAWARYCCKIATGGGKTKVMSLAMVWSYFHSLYENSDMPRHFVVIAPNIIVFERLKMDFADGAVFHSDPLIPPEWKADFDLSFVMQDDAGGGASQGTLYLTNIHRLYERSSRGVVREESPSWAGPPVARAQALKVGEALRERIASHPSIMVMNDEAHHLHDPDSAWNEALNTLNQQSRTHGNRGVVLQLDFTATPKHNDGALFRHIVCDFPLGEAVDAGIVKVPVIGKSEALKEGIGDSASARWRTHLQVGYKQYEHSFEELSGTRKPILFVMTEDTKAADDIAKALDSDDYPLLKNRVINLHTKLKGSIKKVTRFGKEVLEFIENEKQMSDDDLQAIRKISRELDSEDSPYRCVVSVMMLREGWDVRNVTTIVPLRPYSAKSNILAEQTLGRGLRRMAPGDTPERVTVVEHKSFTHLYKEELGEEGLFPEVIEVNGPKPVSVTVFVDGKKDVNGLEIAIPQVSEAIRTTSQLEGLTFEDVRDRFASKYHPLPVKERSNEPILYEERSLFTDELIASWNIDRGLLALGSTAISHYVRELEKACRIQNANAILAPLLIRFIQEVLFERTVSLYDGSIDHRMADNDVVEHIRATFTPLIRERTTTREERSRTANELKLSTWKPYQASMTPRHPCVSCKRTMFNLVPCDSDLELQFAEFCDTANDVTAFARNAGPQKLLIDYLAPNGRPALYAPDFFVRNKDGGYYLVELKGQEDNLVPFKAQAAVEWCKTASTKACRWTYAFIPMAIFDANTTFSIADLARACEPRLQGLLGTAATGQIELPLEMTPEKILKEKTDKAMETAGVPNTDLPDDIRDYVAQAVNQLAFDRKKGYGQLGASFQPLLMPLEQLCIELLIKHLGPCMPQDYDDRRTYFDPYLGDVSPGQEAVLQKNGRNLNGLLVHHDKRNPIGTMLFCLQYASSWPDIHGGIWTDVHREFADPRLQSLYDRLDTMNKFRNSRIVHVDEPLTDGELAETTMTAWIRNLADLNKVAHLPA